MAEVTQRIDVAAAPEEVWRVVGAVGDVHAWIPPAVATTMDGDVRTVTFADGGEARERIDSRSDQSRSYTYTYLDGSIPLDEYTSTITVAAHPEGTGSLVTWTAVLRAAPQVISGIDEMYVASLTELQSMFNR